MFFHFDFPSSGVLPLLVVDKSNFSPSHLTFPHDAPYASFSEGDGPLSSFQIKLRGFFMNQPMSLFFLMLFLVLLCTVCWTHPGPARPRAAAKIRTKLHRPLKPRCPHDCPACRLASTASSGSGQVPLPVRPWREVKSRRGAPKRVNTEGFACPNPQCPYFGIIDSHIHAAVRRWQAWSCRADPDVSLSGLPHHLHFQAQYPFV